MRIEVEAARQLARRLIFWQDHFNEIVCAAATSVRLVVLSMGRVV